MSEKDKHFIRRYEELINKGYCDCNEMNCIDNNSPRRILNVVKNLQLKLDKATNYYLKTLNEYNKENKNMPHEAVEMFNILGENK